MASIYRRGRIWWIKVRIGGKVVRESLQTKDEPEARRIKERYERQGPASLAALPGHRVPYEEAVERFFIAVEPLIETSTYRRYECSSRMLDDILSGKYVDEIDYDLVHEVVAERRALGAALRTVTNDLSYLSGVCDWAITERVLKLNPVLFYRINNRRWLKAKETAIEIPTDEEVARLVIRAPGNFARLIEFLEATGVRQEEAAGAEHSQVDPQRRTLYLPETKTHRPRLVALDDRAWQVYEHTPRHLRSPFIFWHGPDGARYENVASRFRALAAEAGYTKTCHALRNRFSRHFIEQGGEIRVLQSILGHASIKTTERYIRHVELCREQDVELRRLGRRAAGAPSDAS
jgi:site-specific recombinase XerD